MSRTPLFFLDYVVRQNDNHHLCSNDACGLEALFQVLELRVPLSPDLEGKGLDERHYHVCEQHCEEYLLYQEVLQR